MKDAGDVRSESLQPIDLGQVIQQPLDMGGHGRGLGHMRPGGVEASLISVILDTDLLALRGHKAIATPDGIRGTHLLSAGPVIIGKTETRLRKLNFEIPIMISTHLKL